MSLLFTEELINTCENIKLNVNELALHDIQIPKETQKNIENVHKLLLSLSEEIRKFRCTRIDGLGNLKKEKQP